MGTIWDATEKRAHCRTDVAVGIRPNIRPESHVRIVKKQTNKQTWVTDLQRPRRGVSTRDSSQWLWLGSTASGLGGRPGRFIGARKRDDVSDRCPRGTVLKHVHRHDAQVGSEHVLSRSSDHPSGPQMTVAHGTASAFTETRVLGVALAGHSGLSRAGRQQADPRVPQRGSRPGLSPLAH